MAFPRASIGLDDQALVPRRPQRQIGAGVRFLLGGQRARLVAVHAELRRDAESVERSQYVDEERTAARHVIQEFEPRIVPVDEGHEKTRSEFSDSVRRRR